MKNKFIIWILALLTAFVFVFAACAPSEPSDDNPPPAGDEQTGGNTDDNGDNSGNTGDNSGNNGGGEQNEPQTYVVTLDVNGGVPLQHTTQTVTYGQPFNLGSTTRANYNFDGWTYNTELITDANGAGLDVWSIADDVTVVAKWSAGGTSGNTDVSELSAAILNMGYNYTARVFYGGGLSLAYEHICTADGIYKKYGSEYGSSGFIFKDDDLAYYFDLTNGIATIDDEPYTFIDGDPYTREYIYGRDYQVSAINTAYYVNEGGGVYSCLEEYLYQQGRAIAGETIYPAEILIKVTDGYIDYISLNDFDDADYGGSDSIWINFTNIGITSIDEYLITERPPFVSQLPSPTDPDKPTAPYAYESDDVKPVDDFDESVYVNGANDSALPELKTAIDEARQGIRYYFEDYFDDTYNRNAYDWAPSSQYRIAQFEGYKAYVANTYYNYAPVIENYVIKSGGTVYRIDNDGGVIKYVDRGTSFEERTFGGNYFNKLNASMFEQSATNSNVYTVKAAYLNDVCEILFETARGKSSFYNGNPSIVNKSITATLKNGKFDSIIAERVFTFNDGSTDDIQQMKFSFDYNTQLVMPYEIQYSADELVLKNAIAATGNNYTLDYIYYDGTQITEYYADEGVWKWYGQEWGSTGFVYINDYAYFMELVNGELVVDDEPWVRGSDTYYRAWMNLFYLPLAQIDVRDFTRTDENKFELKSSAFNKYENIFFSFADEGGMLSMTIYLDDQGRISKIEQASNIYTTTDTAVSTAYVGNIGSTELPV